jgi:hypothetical protein
MEFSKHRHCVWKAAETIFTGNTDECLTATAIYDAAPDEIGKIGVLTEYMSRHGNAISCESGRIPLQRAATAQPSSRITLLFMDTMSDDCSNFRTVCPIGGRTARRSNPT